MKIEEIMNGWDAESILYCNSQDWQQMTWREARDSEITGLVSIGDDSNDDDEYTYVDAITLAYDIMPDRKMAKAILCRDYDEDCQRNAKTLTAL